MEDNYERYAPQRAKIQEELDRLPRVQIDGRTFRKSSDERAAARKAKSEYESSMFGLFGQNWKKLSKIIGCLNVPSDPSKRILVQKQAEKKAYLFV